MKMPDMFNLKDIFKSAVDFVNPAIKKFSHVVEDIRNAFSNKCELTRSQQCYHGAKAAVLTALFISSVASFNPEAIAATACAIGDEIYFLNEIGEHAQKISEISNNLK